MSRPWKKYYPRDWRADPRLRMCSLAARGLWADLLGYMHEAEPYGHLLVDGKSPTLHDIAALVGRPLGEVRKAFTELEQNGVHSRAEDGAIYSRRMVRDGERSEEGRHQIGKRWDKPNRSPIRSDDAEPITQKPEAREKKESCSNEFEQFWEAYPRRVGKKVAEKALAKALRETSIDTIIGAIARQTPSWTDPKFIPHPASWLNGGRWADEINGTRPGQIEGILY